jgi:hypothetical protein
MSQLNIWWHNRYVNPKTNRKISKNGKVFKKLLKDCLEENQIHDNYSKLRGQKIDPLTYNNCWDPLTGEVLGKDPRGPLYFDPDTLIHFFYNSRLKHLWVDGKDGYSGYYDNGVGNGPDFYIEGRGLSPHFYLFRLPIPDAYCDNLSRQQTTMGPILNLKEIKEIYKLSLLKKDNYKNLFGSKRPNLTKLYKLYHEAIDKSNIDIEYLKKAGINLEDINDNIYINNRKAVDMLKCFK